MTNKEEQIQLVDKNNQQSNNYGTQPSMVESNTSDHMVKTSDFKMANSIIKYFFGIGLLSYAKSNTATGLIPALTTWGLIALVSFSTCSLILKITDANPNRRFRNLRDIVNFVFNRSQFHQSVLQLMIILSQCGTCIAQCTFFKQFFQTVICHLDFKQACGVQSIAALTTFMFTFPMAQIRTVNFLSYLLVVSNVFIFLTVSIITYESIAHMAETGIKSPKLFDFEGIPVQMGNALFTMTTPVILLEYRHSTSSHQTFSKYLKNAYILQATAFCLIPTIWWLAYQDDSKQFVLFNHSIAQTQNLIAYFLGMGIIMISFALQIFPVTLLSDVGWDKIFIDQGWIEPKSKQEKELEKQLDEVEYTRPQIIKRIVQIFSRILIQSTIIIIAYTVSDVNAFIGLVGSVASVYLSVILPLMLYWKYYENDERELETMKWITRSCFFVGVFVGSFGTVSSIQRLYSLTGEQFVAPKF